MGNKLGRRRQVVDEKYTRPQGLYQHKDVDHRKLRKLILDSKLAPCYPGHDDSASHLEDCPICFLYYPSLNRSICCMKGICTGVKTNEEKVLEQLEEQRVIEAKIRMRQQELQDEEDRILKRREISSSSMRGPADVDYCSTRASSFVSAMENEEIVVSQESNPTSARRPSPREKQNREDELDFDLDDIMVMEAIWLSIQEKGRCQDSPYNGTTSSAEYTREDSSSSCMMTSVAGSKSSPSHCLASAIAERRQMNGGSSNYYGGDTLTFI